MQLPGRIDKCFRTAQNPKSPCNFFPYRQIPRTSGLHVSLHPEFSEYGTCTPIIQSLVIIIIQELTSLMLTSIDVQESVSPSQQDMFA